MTTSRPRAENLRYGASWENGFLAVNLNQKSWQRCQQLLEAADRLQISSQRSPGGSQIVDCGVHCPGSLQAGVALAEICLAGLGCVELKQADPALWSGDAVTVTTDEPLQACMASQYAGWKISVGDYFAMGSGPMRAVYAGESLFQEMGYQEQADSIVGVLESGQLPPDEVCARIALDCRVEPTDVTLLVAPTASLAGTVQVVARSLETALHKMHSLGCDLKSIVRGTGNAPLPPVAPDDLTGIGWTNDAVLYGGVVKIWMHGNDQELVELGRRIPSNDSADFGRPFGDIFDSYERDFYKIDPLLFSPAAVQLVNVDTGNCHDFGAVCPEVLQQSFGAE